MCGHNVPPLLRNVDWLGKTATVPGEAGVLAAQGTRGEAGVGRAVFTAPATQLLLPQRPTRAPGRFLTVSRTAIARRGGFRQSLPCCRCAGQVAPPRVSPA